MALGAYLSNVVSIPSEALAVGSIVLISAIHSFSIRTSSRFQHCCPTHESPDRPGGRA